MIARLGKSRAPGVFAMVSSVLDVLVPACMCVCVNLLSHSLPKPPVSHRQTSCVLLGRVFLLFLALKHCFASVVTFAL